MTLSERQASLRGELAAIKRVIDALARDHGPSWKRSPLGKKMHLRWVRKTRELRQLGV